MIVDSSHLISSPWLKYAWVSSMWSGGGSSHHELIIYCLNVHHVNTKILLDNPGDLCTSHDKQRKICRTWFVDFDVTARVVKGINSGDFNFVFMAHPVNTIVGVEI